MPFSFMYANINYITNCKLNKCEMLIIRIFDFIIRGVIYVFG